jgi:hypothetical protein
MALQVVGGYMVEEPVYVPSGRLEGVCEQVLGLIYGHRQDQQEQYVMARLQAHNAAVHARNTKWWRRWTGRVEHYMTPVGMEELIAEEMTVMQSTNPEAAKSHPVCQIHQAYGGLEHQCKDAMIQCKLAESVAVSQDMCRGISHLGLPLDFVKPPRFGFYPR